MSKFGYFFPNPAFAWSFFACLMVLLLAAAIIDIRTTKIPKPLTISIAILGIIFNVARGFCLGGLENRVTWYLPANSVWYGAADGLLFSLAGLLFAFVLYFAMWCLGSCGGGDVKLGAGIGAWIGPKFTIFLLFATVLTLLVWFMGKACVAIASGPPPKNAERKSEKTKQPSLRRWRVTFSFAAAVATAMVMLWFFRVDLQLAAPALEATPAP